MSPTSRLRFVEREVELGAFHRTVDSDGTVRRGTIKTRVLQQWFEREPYTTYGPEGEWRDVPMEVER
jgi:hypothetical protein